MSEQTTVLITGASGFIGSFLVEEGLKRGFTIYAGVRSTSSRAYLQDERIRFIEIDFSSEEKIKQKLLECKEKGIHFDYIIHNAGVTKSQKKGDFHRVNVLNTQHFISALDSIAFIPKKFIFISSLAAYGPGDPQSMKPVLLSDKPNPVELYGKSKLEAERYIQGLKNFPWIILRPTGVYGPREKDYFVFFQTIQRGLETYIGSQQQILTFIYVKDLVRVAFDALLSEICCKAYFVTDGRDYSSEEFAAITKRHLHKKTLKLVVPTAVVKHIATSLESLYRLWGGIPTLNRDKFQVLASRNWRCEVLPLQEDFHFKAEYDLDKGVEETLRWYKEHNWL